jgi:hypothetical protein
MLSLLGPGERRLWADAAVAGHHMDTPSHAVPVPAVSLAVPRACPNRRQVL